MRAKKNPIENLIETNIEIVCSCVGWKAILIGRSSEFLVYRINCQTH